MANRDWSTRVVVRTRTGIVCVRSNNSPWQLPGCKRSESETHWKVTGARGLLEKTGILADDGTIIPLLTHYNRRGKKGRYHLHYCEARVQYARIEKHLRQRGKSGEEVKVIPFNEVRRLKDFHPGHRQFLKRYKLLSPRKE